LFRETLQVPNLVRLRAFRGGSLQIRDMCTPLHLTLDPYQCSGAFQPTNAHALLNIRRKQLIFESSNRLLIRPVFALQPVIAVNLGNQGMVTDFAQRLVHAIVPHIVELKKLKQFGGDRRWGNVNIVDGSGVDLTVICGTLK
jgi:hypothetical protein